MSKAVAAGIQLAKRVAFFAKLERCLPQLLARDGKVLAQVVARCCQIKAEIVRQDETETGQRALLNDGYSGDDNVSSQGANEFVHGVANPNDPRNNPASPASNGGRPQHLHNNTTGGDAVHPDGRANCQKGQQGYAYGLNRFRPAGYDAYARAVVDQPVPDDSIDFGPTFDKYDREGRGVGLGPARVPAGETFTVHPGGTAQQLPAGGLPNKVQSKKARGAQR